MSLLGRLLTVGYSYTPVTGLLEKPVAQAPSRDGPLLAPSGPPIQAPLNPDLRKLKPSAFVVAFSASDMDYPKKGAPKCTFFAKPSVSVAIAGKNQWSQSRLIIIVLLMIDI